MNSEEQNTEQRPYRGMQAFTEEHKNFFFGRTKPVNDIFDLVKNNLLTVIFGTSGIGKSSLLNAGVLPEMRENFFLPVLIRIPFSDPDIDPLAYTQSVIETEIRKYIYKDFKYPENTTLWQFFREANYTGGAVIPVLIFDQFEEYFNFGKARKLPVEKFIEELSDLIENRVPQQLKNNDAYKTLLASDVQNTFRVIISLREDFLAQLEDLSKHIPSLNKIRYRIFPLRGNEALDAVYLPAKNLIDQDTAIRVLKKLIPKKIKAEAGKVLTADMDENDWEQKDFAPYIISLFCYQVNEKRIAANQDKISNELINTTNIEAILEDYYTSSLKKCQRKYHKNIGFILERSLVSNEGYRLLKPANSAEFESIPQQAIKDLVDDRIIQEVNRNEINNIEISHDLLANVIREKKIGGRNKKFTIFAAASIVILLVLSVIIFKQKKDTSVVVAQTKVAIAQTKNAYNDSLIEKNNVNDFLYDKSERLKKTLQEINQSFGGTIYFQVSGPWKNQPQLLRCMNQLRDMKFVVPTAEVIPNKTFKNIIKYFHPEDKSIAEKIQTICEKYYSAIPVQQISLNSDKVSTGTIEVWVNYEHHYEELFSPDPDTRENAKKYLSQQYNSDDPQKTWPKKMVATARVNASNENGIKNTLYVFSKMNADYLAGDRELIISWLYEVQQSNNPEFTPVIDAILGKLSAK